MPGQTQKQAMGRRGHTRAIVGSFLQARAGIGARVLGPERHSRKVSAGTRA